MFIELALLDITGYYCMMDGCMNVMSEDMNMIFI